MPGVAGLPGLPASGAPINGMPTSGGVKARALANDGSVVPPVSNWSQVFNQGLNQGNNPPKESARFEEMTPRDRTARDLRTPGASPRESPRPPDERRDGASTARGEALSQSDEISYEGSYLGSMKHGAGRLRMTGSTYEGDFLNDLKHGSGALAWDDGRQYSGQFDSGKFHGAAVMTWPDGRKYSGQYIEDRKHGEGTFSWQDGRRYQGQWIAGKRHGIGVYTNAKGLTRTGMWEMDRPLHWDVAQAQSGAAGTPADSEAPPPPFSFKTEPTLPKPIWAAEPPRSGRPRPISVNVGAAVDS